MASFGFARCTRFNDEEIGIRFHRIGTYDQFNRLVEEFKLHFPDRYWGKDQWVIPSSQVKTLNQFCKQKGLKIRWQEEGATQLSLLQ
jgi:hypothetical protein